MSTQDHYNLLAREEEREMIPLCLDEGVGTIIWSRLARGRLARPWMAAKSTARAETDGGYADTLYSPRTADSDQVIIDAVGAIATGRGVTRAQVALAWLHSKPVVVAPLVGANTPSQIDDAVASLEIELAAEELAALEGPYTPRYDFQGISDEAELQKDQEPDTGVHRHVGRGLFLQDDDVVPVPLQRLASCGVLSWRTRCSRSRGWPASTIPSILSATTS